MKTNFLLFLVCALFTVTSCTHHKDAKGKQSEVAENVSLVDENFDSFLEHFNSKPTFQRQRVMFPLEASLLSPTENGLEPVDEKIKYHEWILLDFTYDSSYTTRQMDRYEQHIRVYDDSSIIEQRGIDNGIFANYYFIKKDGKWFLKSFTDVTY
ncbi:MAG TPA: hypothetical protein VFC69_04955 [Dysgonamonadaceae bacterium]|nr:hypothetical protein [Dysgonamonadaceae bacterium]